MVRVEKEGLKKKVRQWLKSYVSILQVFSLWWSLERFPEDKERDMLKDLSQSEEKVEDVIGFSKQEVTSQDRMESSLEL